MLKWTSGSLSEGLPVLYSGSPTIWIDSFYSVLPSTSWFDLESRKERHGRPDILGQRLLSTADDDG